MKINLVDLPVLDGSQSNEVSPGFQTGDGSEGIFVIDSLDLFKSLGYEPGLVSVNTTVFVEFTLVNPLALDSLVARRQVD